MRAGLIALLTLLPSAAAAGAEAADCAALPPSLPHAANTKAATPPKTNFFNINTPFCEQSYPIKQILYDMRAANTKNRCL